MLLLCTRNVYPEKVASYAPSRAPSFVDYACQSGMTLKPRRGGFPREFESMDYACTRARAYFSGPRAHRDERATKELVINRRPK